MIQIMKQLALTLVLALIIKFAFCQAMQFPYGREKRRYTIYLPGSYYQQQNKLLPLVFNFHGGGITITEHMFYSRMNVAAEKHQFIVIYPQGLKQDWNVGFEMAYQKGIDDVGFTKALLEHMVNDYRVDQEAVYATSLSRVGFFLPSPGGGAP
jgi:polyhydroxybutyrate depolymerase